LRNGGSVTPSAFEVLDVKSRRVVAASSATQAFYVPPGNYVYSFDVPAASGSNAKLRHARLRLAFPVQAKGGAITTLAAFLPELVELPAFMARHVGDSRLGSALKELRSQSTSDGVVVNVSTKGTSWFLVAIPRSSELVELSQSTRGSTAPQPLKPDVDYTLRSAEAHQLLRVKAEAGRRLFRIRVTP
jgi:hypothetical protein